MNGGCASRIVGSKRAALPSTHRHIEMRNGENAFRMKSADTVNNTKTLRLGNEKPSSKVKAALAALAIDE
jgi:hypothetical protein